MVRQDDRCGQDGFWYWRFVSPLKQGHTPFSEPTEINLGLQRDPVGVIPHKCRAVLVSSCRNKWCVSLFISCISFRQYPEAATYAGYLGGLIVSVPVYSRSKRRAFRLCQYFQPLIAPPKEARTVCILCDAQPARAAGTRQATSGARDKTRGYGLGPRELC